MAQTYRNLNAIREVALAVQDSNPNGTHERKQAGDIIVCRMPHSGIGLREMKEYVWLRLELDENVADRLMDSLEENGSRFEKRRYAIPLNRLSVLVSGFELSRAQDSADPYQPFLNVDEETGFFLAASKPLRAEGLIFDKLTGRSL